MRRRPAATTEAVLAVARITWLRGCVFRVPDYLTTLFNLRGKVALLTGAAGYLVSVFARAMARSEMKMALLDVDGAAVQRVGDQIGAAGVETFASKMDVTKKADWKRALSQTVRRFGRVDVLVNGAGINAPTPFLDITEREWNRILAVQLTGTMLGCQVIGQRMIEQGAGSIINISSASSGPALSKAFTYSVAKSGVKNLTQNLAREWATRGVRVNALRPGFFPTEWSKKNFLTPDRVQRILGHTPMNRFGEPQELVGMVLLLASDASRFITGAELPVDGGFTAMTI